ncbi:hypothetical protein [Nocardiopsis lambiniae]|uniref:Uncharacterized protein n=1 Tax=Nocardiopsis lambiniae TaxID=3075539 RepID=A0ABU2MG70_9ACTN|nr:hypothetical protein [Nocardiopsis sp. DSM 44743]MDT0330846.1 hypothetical protein [Nocardiopsis sp. DSM 44743]
MPRTAHHVEARRRGRSMFVLRRDRSPGVRRVRVRELARGLLGGGSPGPEETVAERRRARRAADPSRRAVVFDGRPSPEAAEEMVRPPGRHRGSALWSV